MQGEKKKGCQNEVNPLNMLQEWDGEVFIWTQNMKAKTEYTKRQKGNRTMY
jgi:hypothetical protein